MNDKTWQQTGKGQYILKDVPYTGYDKKPARPTGKGWFPVFFAGFADSLKNRNK